MTETDLYKKGSKEVVHSKTVQYNLLKNVYSNTANITKGYRCIIHDIFLNDMTKSAESHD